MADQFNTLDFNPSSSKSIVTRQVSIDQNVTTLISPASPNKTRVLVQAFTPSDYIINDSLGQGPTISAIVGSVYPIQVEFPTSDNVYGFQTILLIGILTVTEFFNT